jgi:hypothetical protein
MHAAGSSSSVCRPGTHRVQGPVGDTASMWRSAQEEGAALMKPKGRNLQAFLNGHKLGDGHVRGYLPPVGGNAREHRCAVDDSLQSDRVLRSRERGK